MAFDGQSTRRRPLMAFDGQSTRRRNEMRRSGVQLYLDRLDERVYREHLVNVTLLAFDLKARGTASIACWNEGTRLWTPNRQFAASSSSVLASLNTLRTLWCGCRSSGRSAVCGELRNRATRRQQDPPHAYVQLSRSSLPLLPFPWKISVHLGRMVAFSSVHIAHHALLDCGITGRGLAFGCRKSHRGQRSRGHADTRCNSDDARLVLHQVRLACEASAAAVPISLFLPQFPFEPLRWA